MEWAPAQAMLAQIRQETEFIHPAVESLFLQLLRNVDVNTLRRARKVYLTGCGDSWFVGIASRLAFEKYAAIEAEALQAMEFSRYTVARASPNAILLAVSHSGEVARTIEAALLAKEKDIYTIAVTGSPDSTLARNCNAALHYEIPPVPSEQALPGTISFLGCLIAAYILAIYIGEVNGNTPHPRADNLYYELKKSAEKISPVIKNYLKPISDWALKISHSNPLQCIGSGPNFATALYAQMKLLEAAAMPSLVFETEEWAHAGFFLTQLDTPLFIFCAEGTGKHRTQEILQPARELRSNILLVTNAPELKAPFGTTLLLGEDIQEEFTPLIFSVPAQLLAYAVMQTMKTTPFGFDDKKRREINSQQIRKSNILRSLKDLGTQDK